jgi:response regulator RpfG family c-di-GMP phosphodiesterase
MAVPIVYRENVVGVIFFNAKEIGYFSEKRRQKDFIYLAQAISSRYIQVIDRRSNFNKLLQVALKIGHHRDPETSQHLIRMGKYSEALARLLAKNFPQITTEFIHRIRFYAPFHDIGKYRIPDEVLFSDKKFSPQEREIMNKHPVFGEEIIDEVARICDLNNTPREELTFVKNIIRYHHEAYDGTGYPEGLSDSNIPLEARIVTLADVFDALLSKRPYKEPWNMTDVIQFIQEKSGTLFDPLCVKALLENINEFLSIREFICDDTPTPFEYPNHQVTCSTHSS